MKLLRNGTISKKSIRFQRTDRTVFREWLLQILLPLSLVLEERKKHCREEGKNHTLERGMGIVDFVIEQPTEKRTTNIGAPNEFETKQQQRKKNQTHTKQNRKRTYLPAESAVRTKQRQMKRMNEIECPLK